MQFEITTKSSRSSKLFKRPELDTKFNAFSQVVALSVLRMQKDCCGMAYGKLSNLRHRPQDALLKQSIVTTKLNVITTLYYVKEINCQF